jgi:hypothetical protein
MQQRHGAASTHICKTKKHTQTNAQKIIKKCEKLIVKIFYAIIVLNKNYKFLEEIKNYWVNKNVK